MSRSNGVSQQGPATLLAPVSVAYCRAASLCQRRQTVEPGAFFWCESSGTGPSEVEMTAGFRLMQDGFQADDVALAIFPGQRDLLANRHSQQRDAQWRHDAQGQ